MPLRHSVVIAIIAIAASTHAVHEAPRDVQIRSVDFRDVVIELHNFDTEPQALDGWRFCSHDDNERRIYTHRHGLDGVSIQPGSSLFIHMHDDAPSVPGHLNGSEVGGFAEPLDRGPYGLSLYKIPVGGHPDFDTAVFGNPANMVDHVQWSFDGADDETADERSFIGVRAGLWTDQSVWVATRDDTAEIRLTDESGGRLHGPGDYEVLSGTVPVDPRSVQIRSVNIQRGMIELYNFADTARALDGWRFCSHNAAQIRVYSLPDGLDGVTIAGDSSFFIHLNDDAPAETGTRNGSDVGPFAPLGVGPYGLSLYFPPVDFDDGRQIADHVQWNIDGRDDSRADERTDEAVDAGVWVSEIQWVATTLTTVEIRLSDLKGRFRHGRGDYFALDEVVEPEPRDVQIRSVLLDRGIIELFNFGTVPASLEGWRLCTSNGAVSQIYTDPSGLDGVTIPPGESFLISLRNDGTGDGIRNIDEIGAIAPIGTGPFALSIFFPPVDFEDGKQIADHLQWNIDGVDDETAGARSEQAEAGGVWLHQEEWISTTETTTIIRLIDSSGSLLHEARSYEVIEEESPEAVAFNRGDPNDDGQVDISDPIAVLGLLFGGGDEVGCMDAGDGNGDGELDISDAVYLLSHLFLDGQPPSHPGGPDSPCGVPPAPSPLGCESYRSCVFSTAADLAEASECDGELRFQLRTVPVGERPEDLTAADVDGDSMVDLLVANSGDGSLTLLLGQGDATFATGEHIPLNAQPGSVVVGPIAGDALPDAVVTLPTGILVLVNEAGSFALRGPFEAGSSPSSPVIADMTGDGVTDVVVANVESNTVAVLPGDGTGTLSEAIVLDFNDVLVVIENFGTLIVDVGVVAAGDLDGDLDPELIVFSRFINAGFVAPNLGGGSFGEPLVFRTGFAHATAAAIADFDGDGNNDVALAHGGFANRVTLLAGDGAGRLELSQSISLALGGVSGDIAAADLDGDNDMDLAAVDDFGGRVGVLRNVNGFFAVEPTVPVGSAPRAIVLDDFDGDGVTDAATADSGDGALSVLVNLCGKPFDDTTPPPAPTGLTATAGSFRVTLSWDPSPVADFLQFEVFQSTDPATGFDRVATLSQTTFATFGANGTEHFFFITAVDLAGNVSPVSSTVSATPRAPRVHVDAIRLGTETANGHKVRALAIVRIVDDLGRVASGARVTGSFSRDFSERVAATTDANGEAVLKTTSSARVRSGFGFCVESVSLPGFAYDRSANRVTCASF